MFRFKISILAAATAILATIFLASAALASLPSGWSNGNIGSTGLNGSATFASNKYTIKGSGADIWGSSDAFHYAYQPLTGDGEITARVVSQSNTHSQALAGVMIRESLNSNSRHALAAVTPGDGVGVTWRTNTGGSSTYSDGPSSAKAPYSVRLNRTGNVITAYRSQNGTSWTQIAQKTVNMSSSVYIGLAVTSHKTNQLSTAVFENVSVTGSSPTEPEPPVETVTTPFNDTVIGSGSNQFEFSGAWESGPASDAYQQDNHYTNDSSAYYQFKFDGVQAKLYAEKNNAIGIYAVSVDGGPETLIDGYASTRQDQQLLYTSPVLSNGTHTLKVRNTGTKNSASGGIYIVADRVDVVTETTPPTGDTTAPTVPTGLTTGIVTVAAVPLTWTASTDNVAVTGYQVFRNGSSIGTSATTDFTDSTVAPDTTYSYTVKAVDAAGNVSAASNALAVTTPAIPPSGDPIPAGIPGNWQISFQDEFEGNSLDTSKWESTWFGEGTVMNNVGTYSSNVSVSDGSLKLQLSSNSRGALIHTGYKPGHYQLPVGSVAEARIYFPGNGTTIYNWPAWWANSTNDYPTSGEHDIAEGLEELTVNYHSPSGSHNQGVVPGIWSNNYHTYAVHRLANSAKVYWDGNLVKSYPTDDDGAPIDLILNVGTGQGPTVLGQNGAMRVDYVRAWQPL